MWQFWAGRRTGWQNYSESVSASLSYMAAHGPVEAEFIIAGATYRINVVQMTQDNQYTGAAPREIRVRPADEVE